MRVVFDVLGAPGASGGMRQYSELVIRAWIDRHPGDEVLVVGDRWASDLHPRARHVRWGSDRFLSRAIGQLAVVALVHHRNRADVTISVSTMVSALVPARRRICVVHDWRHLYRPEEFGRGQLLYRRLWKRSARTAGAVASISAKTLRESRAAVPAARHVLVPSGHDHAAAWGLDGVRPDPARSIVSFGHHANKRPHLVLDAFARSRASEDHRLVLLGARGELASDLALRAERAGVAAAVELPGFVEEEEYRRRIAASSVVVLASSDEGFGLPGAEASHFGVPFVTTDDNGLADIHPHALSAAPTPDALASALDRAVEVGRGAPGGTAGVPGWGDTADLLRGTAERCLARAERRTVPRRAIGIVE